MLKKIKSKKTQAILVIIVAILFSIISSIFFYNELCNFPETLYYCSQIICNFFVIGGVFIAVWEYHLAQKNAKNSLELAQVQKAIDLSEYYKDNILAPYPIVNWVFGQLGINDIFDSIDNDKIKDFDKVELNRIFSANDIKRLKDIQNTDEFVQTIIYANEVFGLGIKSFPDKAEIKSPNNKITTYKFDKTNTSTHFMSKYVNGILNNMEYFALHFKHNTADESVVYQSLHQSYLEIVRFFYYYIANNNEHSTEKLYTNVIWLYEKWSTEKNVQHAERSQKSKSLERQGTVISN